MRSLQFLELVLAWYVSPHALEDILSHIFVTVVLTSERDLCRSWCPPFSAYF